jgi:hypothetical protein
VIRNEEQDDRNYTVTYDGRLIVDANRLFESPKVQQALTTLGRKLKESGKRPRSGSSKPVDD